MQRYRIRWWCRWRYCFAHQALLCFISLCSMRALTGVSCPQLTLDDGVMSGKCSGKIGAWVCAGVSVCLCVCVREQTRKHSPLSLSPSLPPMCLSMSLVGLALLHPHRVDFFNPPAPLSPASLRPGAGDVCTYANCTIGFEFSSGGDRTRECAIFNGRAQWTGAASVCTRALQFGRRALGCLASSMLMHSLTHCLTHCLTHSLSSPISLHVSLAAAACC